ncbi:DUF4192 family protein [Couchioplanes azureus]|uniref:DUF4192 family protein n=1 Tax=Couchioplanes caeruleus TaxID=56438 RepID=UPI00199A8EF5|nr:DUF4192 family protein [Couchioplanes caeruleus]GGQ45310.1 hypothetical protein GCM10010166_12370 [Couchioplanes caeruleus subsp. azureus]
MTKLKVRTPADLIAAVPFLIGFHPADSLVVAAVTGAKLAFAARIDLPEPGIPDLEARAPVLHLAALVAEQRPESIALIGYGDSDRVTPSLRHLSHALSRAGLRIVDEFRVADGRYWSYRCIKQRCCPQDGRLCHPPDSVVAAEATFAGAVALPSRRDLEAQLAPVTGADREAMDAADERALTNLLDLLRQEPAQDDGGTASEAEDRCRSERLILRAGRAAVRSAERRYRSGGRLSDDEVAWLGHLLTSVPVRDYAWIRSGMDDWQISLWSDVVRRVNPQRVPAPASLLSFIAWRTNRAALAAVAVERALEVDPHYSLAETMNATLYSAVPPSTVAGWPTPTGRPAPEEPGYSGVEDEDPRAKLGGSDPGAQNREANPDAMAPEMPSDEAAAHQRTRPGETGEKAGPGTEPGQTAEHGTEADQTAEPGIEAGRTVEQGMEAARPVEPGIDALPRVGEQAPGAVGRTGEPGIGAGRTAEPDKADLGGETGTSGCRETGAHLRRTRPVRSDRRSCGRPAWPAGHRTITGGSVERRTVRRRR